MELNSAVGGLGLGFLGFRVWVGSWEQASTQGSGHKKGNKSWMTPSLVHLLLQAGPSKNNKWFHIFTQSLPKEVRTQHPFEATELVRLMISGICYKLTQWPDGRSLYIWRDDTLVRWVGRSWTPEFWWSWQSVQWNACAPCNPCPLSIEH